MLASEHSHRQQQQQQQQQQEKQQPQTQTQLQSQPQLQQLRALQQQQQQQTQQQGIEMVLQQPRYAKRDTFVVSGGKYFTKGTSIMISQVSRAQRSRALNDDKKELNAARKSACIVGDKNSERKSLLAVVGGLILLFLCQHNRLGSF